MVGNKWPTQSPTQLNKFFGDPDVNDDGQQDAKWAAANLVKIAVPYPMFYAGKALKTLTCHKKVAESLSRVLTRIAEEFTPAEIKRYKLDEFGGINNFRAKRGNPNSLSVHSWAIAIDLSPTINAFRVKYGSRPNMMPLKVVEFFQAEGWDWGGLWSSGDAMHFQAAGSGAGQDISKIKLAGSGSTTGANPVKSKPTKSSDIYDGNYHVEVEQVQKALNDLGYPEVGTVDGKWGNKTRGVILAFRADNELPLEPVIDDELRAALLKAEPREIGRERATTTAKDLREKGSMTVKAADAIKVGAATVGAGGLVLGGADSVENADPVGNKLGILKQVVDIIDPVKDFIGANLWWILPAVGVVAFFYAQKIIKVRVDDHRTGKNVGL